MNQLQADKLDNTKIVKFIGLLLIGMYSALCSMYNQGFAHLHIKLDFLSFPIFVGEIFLFACLILLFATFKLERISLKPWHFWVIAYVVWLMIKALTGYMEGGALALRKSALFYYPLFALCAFYFYDKSFFTQRNILVLTTALIFVLYFSVRNHHIYTYMALTPFMISRIKNNWFKLIYLVIFLSLFNYNNVFTGSKTLILSLLIILVFLLIFFAFPLLKSNSSKTQRKAIMFLSMIVIMAIASVLIYNRNRLSSVTNFFSIVESYFILENDYQDRSRSYVRLDIKPKLYGENKDLVDKFKKSLYLDKLTKDEEFKKESDYVSEIDKELEAIEEKAKELAKGQNVEEVRQKLIKDLNNMLEEVGDKVENDEDLKEKYSRYVKMSVPQVFTKRDTKTELANVVFRLFIWRDMVEEVIEKRALLGMNFGLPQRSKRVETIGIAFGEWYNVGWITPHNSFMHMFYLGGIVGIAILIGIFGFFVHLVRRFLKFKTFSGVILCSIILYWFLVSSFNVILEFPYYAISFWSLWGLIAAYCHHLEPQN